MMTKTKQELFVSETLVASSVEFSAFFYYKFDETVEAKYICWWYSLNLLLEYMWNFEC